MTDEDVDDPEVFAAAYGRLRRFASVVRSQPDVDPDDLVQEALARTLAAGGLARLQDPERYLRTVICRLAYEEDRRRRRWARAVPKLTVGDGFHDAMGLPVSVLLERLGPQDRALLFLVEVEGLPVREAAGLAGVRETAARMRLTRARRRARALLSDHGGEDDDATS